MGGADGLGIRRLRAHQHDALYDQDSAELASAALRSDLHSDRARSLVGCCDFAHPTQAAVDLKRSRFAFSHAAGLRPRLRAAERSLRDLALGSTRCSCDTIPRGFSAFVGLDVPDVSKRIFYPGGSAFPGPIGWLSD